MSIFKMPYSIREANEFMANLEKAVAHHGSLREVAKQNKISWSTFHLRLSKAKHLSQDAPEDFIVKRKSIHTGKDGKKSGWLIVEPDKEKQYEQMKQAVKSLVSDIKPIQPIEPPKHCDSQLLTVIPMGDPHIGLMTWEEEVGEKFDLEIAVNDLFNAVKYLVDTAPHAERCAIINLGDFFHADNMEGKTSRSGHILEMACRRSEMVKVGMKLMRYIVEYTAKSLRRWKL